MKSEEKLYYLISEYEKGKYTAKDFCNLFEEYYYHEDPVLSAETDKWFRELALRCARFSDYEDDFKLKNIYFTKADIDDYLKQISYFIKSADVTIKLSKAEALALYDMANRVNNGENLYKQSGDKQLFGVIENLLEKELVEIFYPNYNELVEIARKDIVEKYGELEKEITHSPIDTNKFNQFINRSDIFEITRSSMLVFLENWYEDNPNVFIQDLGADYNTVIKTYHFYNQMVGINKSCDLDTIICIIRITDEDDSELMRYTGVFDYQLKMIDDFIGS